MHYLLLFLSEYKTEIEYKLGHVFDTLPVLFKQGTFSWLFFGLSFQQIDACHPF